MCSVFYFVGAFLKKDSLLQAGTWTLWSGTLLAAVAVWTGLRAAYTVPHNDETHRIMELHQNMGYAILAVAIILSAWLLIVKASIPKRGKIVFLMALVLLNLILIQQTDLGGRMVFLHGTGVGKKSMLGQAQPNPLKTHVEHEGMGH